MEIYSGLEVGINTFLTSAEDGGELSASCFIRFDPKERALTPIEIAI
jgi:hypothetical protein